MVPCLPTFWFNQGSGCCRISRSLGETIQILSEIKTRDFGFVFGELDLFSEKVVICFWRIGPFRQHCHTLLSIIVSTSTPHSTPPPPPPSSLSRPLSVHIHNIMFTTSTRFSSTTINNSHLCHSDHLPGTVCTQMTSISIVRGTWNHFIIFYVYTAFFFTPTQVFYHAAAGAAKHIWPSASIHLSERRVFFPFIADPHCPAWSSSPSLRTEILAGCLPNTLVLLVSITFVLHQINKIVIDLSNLCSSLFCTIVLRIHAHEGKPEFGMPYCQLSKRWWLSSCGQWQVQTEPAALCTVLQDGRWLWAS